jgi:CheY-like chemotaxis protein
MIQPSAIVLDPNRRNTGIEEVLVDCSRDTAIISCSLPSEQRAAQAYGAADYLVKPITQQALIKAIKALAKPIHNILVVDDERDVTRMLSRMIAAYDQRCEVLQANNGEDGLAIMYREHPDLVLLDIQMPVMDGFATLHHMKNDLMLQDIPVIIASAHGAGGAITSAVEGAITVLRPNGFSPVELINCVDAVVSVLMPPSGPTPPES